MTWSSPRTDCFLRVGLLGSAILTGGKFLPRLNMSRKPIAHKYREGNVKSTLKRELKVFETVMVKKWDLLVHVVRCAGTSVHENYLDCGLRVCQVVFCVLMCRV
jgi:hypothetical protein